jgi:hypothetical protein
MSRLLVVRMLFWTPLILGVVGCEPVDPWDRGNLAKAQMALEPNGTNSALRAHTFAAREATQGSNAGVGGGCGCN